ncbi:hypothetical protein FKM82_020825 [Ascaphus truei]
MPFHHYIKALHYRAIGSIILHSETHLKANQSCCKITCALFKKKKKSNRICDYGNSSTAITCPQQNPVPVSKRNCVMYVGEFLFSHNKDINDRLQYAVLPTRTWCTHQFLSCQMNTLYCVYTYL